MTEIKDVGTYDPSPPSTAYVPIQYASGGPDSTNHTDIAGLATGGGVDYVQAADPGAVGAGKIWLQKPFPAPDTLWPAWTAATPFGNDDAVLPTADVAANGPRVFRAINNGGGTTDVSEPDWTLPSPITDGTVTWTFMGAIPAGVRFPLWIRNDSDSGWQRIGTAGFRDALHAVGISVDLRLDFYDAFYGLGLSEVGPDRGRVIARFSPPDGTQSGWALSPARLDYFDSDPSYQGANTPIRSIIVGTVAPSAGAGVVAGLGSMFSRDSGGTTGELWVKTGAADTAWTKVV